MNIEEMSLEELLKKIYDHCDAQGTAEAEILRRFGELENYKYSVDNTPFGHWKQRAEAAEAKLKEAEAIFSKVKDLCNLICNSSPDTTIKGEIESKAFYLGHHPEILKAEERHD